MTLNSSGPISIGGTTNGQSIEQEINGSTFSSPYTSTASLNDSSLRGLVNISSGQISFSNFLGASSFTLNPISVMGSPSSNTIMNSITVDSSGLFVAVGYTLDSPRAVYAYSTDTGSTWTTPVIMNNSTLPAYMMCITVNSSGLFVAVGYVFDNNTYALYPVYATSTNGSVWTSPTAFPGGTSGVMNAITVNSSGLFVSVGFDLNNKPTYATSSNGSTWTTPTTIGVQNFNPFAIAVNSSGLFVSVGYIYENSTLVPKYMTSSNGSTWTTPTAMPNFSANYFAVNGLAVNSSGLFVAVGHSSGILPMYATSTNGSTWTTPVIMNNTTTTGSLYGIAVNSSGLFVAVGYPAISPASQNAFYVKSSDGSNWTNPIYLNLGANTSQALYSIAVNSSDKFAAVGLSTATNPYPAYTTSNSKNTISSTLNYIFAASTMNASLNVNTLTGYIPGSSNIRITVGNGVYLWSNSVTTPGLTLTGGTTGDSITLVNKGYIMGKGGKGGNYSDNSTINGGPALSLGYSLTIDNTNGFAYIGGGGGGGGWMGFGACSPSFVGGGGGAGGGDGGQDNFGAPGGSGGSIGGVGASGGESYAGAGGGRVFPGIGGGTAGGGSGYTYQYNPGPTPPCQALWRQYRGCPSGDCTIVTWPGIPFAVYTSVCGNVTGPVTGQSSTGTYIRGALRYNSGTLYQYEVGRLCTVGGGGAGGSGGSAGKGGNGGAGGSANGVGGNADEGSGYANAGGGGGWGASGGTASHGQAYYGNPGSGGKAVKLNGYSVSWVNGDTTRVYGAVS